MSKEEIMKTALLSPLCISKELNNRSFYHFVEYFWDEYSSHPFESNWHIVYLCDELQKVAERVAEGLLKENDILINIPPGMTKTAICSIMFPVWCWTRWYWMKFITASYSSDLSLESAEYSRDLIRSAKFKAMYTELDIKEDKDSKSNYKVIKKSYSRPNKVPTILNGGNRYSTSVGGTLTGYHADIIIWDDPLNPQKAASEKELISTNRWIDLTLPTRKTNKAVSVVIGIMQRLHQNDPTGHILAKNKTNVKLISLPGEIVNYKDKVRPIELLEKYEDGLLDVNRLSWAVLKDLEADLGQYGYAGQIGQDPTPPGGGMFKVDHFQIVQNKPADVNFISTIRYWDKAGSQGKGCYTVGTKMASLAHGRWIILDVKRGQWAAEERERIIKETAITDGGNVLVYIEQEPGSGGKESAEATVRNLAGFSVHPELPTGNKVLRADPYSVQVNNGNVMILQGAWNTEFIEEHRFFPFSTYKDQVDASSGAFNNLVVKRMAGRVT